MQAIPDESRIHPCAVPVQKDMAGIHIIIIILVLDKGLQLLIDPLDVRPQRTHFHFGPLASRQQAVNQDRGVRTPFAEVVGHVQDPPECRLLGTLHQPQIVRANQQEPNFGLQGIR